MKKNAVMLSMMAIGAVYVVLAINYLPFTVDDSFITYRHADNLARGRGLVYNEGERVEGTSNFLFAVMLAVVRKSGGDLLAGAKVLGVLFGALTLFFTFALSRSINGSGGVRALIAPSFTVANVSFLAWSVGGLETTLYAFLLTLALYLMHGETTGRRFPWSAVVFGLLSLTRPEGIFFALALIVTVNFIAGRQTLRYNLLWLGMLAAVFVPFECWRWWYYGKLLPNTCYAKVHLSSPGLLVNTIRYYCLGYADANGGTALYLLGLVPLGILSGRKTYVRLLGSAVAIQVAYIILVNGDWMPTWRFFVPITGILAVLISQGLIGLYREGLKKIIPLPVAVISLALILAASLSTGHTAFKIQFPGFFSWYKNPTYDAIINNIASNSNYVLMARWINENIPDKTRTLAVGEAGYVPYATGMRTVDLYGLTNPEILAIPDVKKNRMGVGLVSPKAAHESGPLYRYMNLKKTDYLLLSHPGNASADSVLWGGLYVLIHRSGNLCLYRKN
ncbi:MAG: glycosyltransferase family 39 protein [Chitinispirillaceae bacterium]|nr:glycosyltransferase family 39 protein [Chitinispirillaceae bacterium]